MQPPSLITTENLATSGQSALRGPRADAPQEGGERFSQHLQQWRERSGGAAHTGTASSADAAPLAHAAATEWEGEANAEAARLVEQTDETPAVPNAGTGSEDEAASSAAGALVEVSASAPADSAIRDAKAQAAPGRTQQAEDAVAQVAPESGPAAQDDEETAPDYRRRGGGEAARIRTDRSAIDIDRSAFGRGNIESSRRRAPVLSVTQPVQVSSAPQMRRDASREASQTSGAADSNDISSLQPVDRDRSMRPSSMHIDHDLPPAEARALEVDTAIRMSRLGGGEPLAPDDSAGDPSRSAAPGFRVASGSISPQGAIAEHGVSASNDAMNPRSATEADPATSRVVRSMHAMLNHRGGVMTMRLDPPELGSLTIRMTVLNGAVTARFEAETAAAQQLLQQNMATLRTSLESQGLHVERLHVHTAQQHGESQMNNHNNSDRGESQAQQQQQSQRHADAGQGESRGRYDDGRDQQQRPNHRDEGSEAHRGRPAQPRFSLRDAA